MLSTSGAELLSKEGIKALCTTLLKITTIVTPNVPEAVLILKTAGVEVEEPKSITDLVNIAEKIKSLGPEWVVVKGGHLPLKRDGTAATAEDENEIIVDILLGQGSTHQFQSEYQKSIHTHGTGCSLACTLPSVYSRQCSNTSKLQSHQTLQKDLPFPRPLSLLASMSRLVSDQGRILAKATTSRSTISTRLIHFPSRRKSILLFKCRCFLTLLVADSLSTYSSGKM